VEIRIPPEQFSPEHPPPKSSRICLFHKKLFFTSVYRCKKSFFFGNKHIKDKKNSAGATSPLLLRSLTTTVEQIALREILLLDEIQG
jgi:hypothetical protein